ncbi:MAG: tRNA (adenosine(37)-N6)-threonylcarbamoyltransferase complex dimerization subunit type 1 TsaB [Myxococcales bacterium]|nr:tRNA (adenosine(37)-N6)-threonylcarbamoyltransferase complex dimerization subunit type 1 TsaB [Myxococcales bacterium]
MSAILAVETSTLIASVALVRDGTVVLARESGVNTHSETLLALIDECLGAGDLTLGELTTIAVGAGPGSFTGLRIGMATVKGLCFAVDTPLTPVSSLAALAYDAQPHCAADSVIASVLDARRKEIFVGLFARKGERLVSIAEEQVLAPNALPELLVRELSDSQRSRLVLVGDGAGKYAELLAGLGTLLGKAPQTPTASAVAFLAQDLPPVDVLASAKPTYVRLPEAELKFPDGNTGGTFSMQGRPSRTKAAAERKPGK